MRYANLWNVWNDDFWFLKCKKWLLLSTTAIQNLRKCTIRLILPTILKMFFFLTFGAKKNQKCGMMRAAQWTVRKASFVHIHQTSFTDSLLSFCFLFIVCFLHDVEVLNISWILFHKHTSLSVAFCISNNEGVLAHVRPRAPACWDLNHFSSHTFPSFFQAIKTVFCL